MKKINVFDYIPGFRSRKIWKMVIAVIYYISCFTAISTMSFADFLGMFSLPFIIFGITGAIKRKSFINLIIGVAAIAVFAASVHFAPPKTEPINEAALSAAASASTAAPIAEPTPKPTAAPTAEPTPKPTAAPTAAPTMPPAAAPVNGAVDDSAAQTRSMPGNDDSEYIVYRGKTGDKYHRASCRTLKGGGIPITLEEAKSQGRQACKICNP